MANLYATVNEYHAEKEITTAFDSLTAAQSARILRALRRASRRIDTFCGRHFFPKSATENFDFLNAREVIFDPFDLLEATTVTTGGDELTDVASTKYDLLTGSVYGLYPKSRLMVHTDADITLDVGDRFEQANRITGIWGYHTDWDNAWLDSLDEVEDNPLTAAATSLTVNDSDGADADGITPRFQIGQLLKIESEYVYVSAVNDTTNVLTIVRGQNGTTAAQHAQNTAVSVYQPMDDVKEACLLAASYFMNLPRAPFGTIEVGSGDRQYAVRLTLPASAAELISPFVYVPVGVLRQRRAADETGRLYPDGVNPWLGL